MKNRELIDHEILILKFFRDYLGNSAENYSWPDRAFDLDDGGMGSIIFSEKKLLSPTKVIGSCMFEDIDDVPVICDLFADKEFELTELSFWKVSFEPVKVFPKHLNEMHSDYGGMRL